MLVGMVLAMSALTSAGGTGLGVGILDLSWVGAFG